MKKNHVASVKKKIKHQNLGARGLFRTECARATQKFGEPTPLIGGPVKPPPRLTSSLSLTRTPSHSKVPEINSPPSTDLPAPMASSTSLHKSGLRVASSTRTSQYLSPVVARRGRPYPGHGPALTGMPRLVRRGIRRGQSRRVPPRGAAQRGRGQQWPPTLPATC